MIATLLIAATLAATSDCPTPKRLTCDQLKAKVVERCPKEPESSCAIECTCPTLDTACPTCAEVPSPKVETHYIFQDVPAKPEGHPFVAFGIGYMHGVGPVAGGGYRWPNGWGVMGQAMYIPQNGTADVNGVAVQGCVRIPYTVAGEDAKHPWGGAVLAEYSW